MWTRTGGIQASTLASGFRCLGYVQVARPWSLVSGECEVDGQGCIQSPGYGHALYSNLQECEFSVSAAYPMEVVDFQVESQDYDYLLVNGEKYSGNNMPHGTLAEAHAKAHFPSFSKHLFIPCGVQFSAFQGGTKDRARRQHPLVHGREPDPLWLEDLPKALRSRVAGKRVR